MNNTPQASNPLVRWLQYDRTVAAAQLLLTLILGLVGPGWIWPVGVVLALLVLLPGIVLRTAQPQAVPTIDPVPVPVTPPPAPAGPDLSRLRGHYREIMEQALQGQAQIKSGLDGTANPAQRKVLADAVKDLPNLINSIYTLAQKAQNTSDGLASGSSTQELTEEVQHLQERISASNDAVLDSQYSRSLDRKLQQLQNIADTTVALRRMDAQLENALSTLETLRSQLMRIESSEVLAYSGATDRLSGELQEAVDSLNATANAMDSVYGWDTRQR